MKFQTLKSWTDDVLTAVEFSGITIEPGPALPDVPDEFVVWTPYGGPGLDAEGALDAQSWQMRVAGKQNNYQSAEDIATAIDLAVMNHFSSEIGGVWVSYIQRVGGAPTALMVDDADRTQFVCSYVFGADAGLTN